MDEQENRVLQHKLIEPLVVILGHAGLMSEGLVGQLTEDQKKRITKIKEAAEKLEKNIREFVFHEGSPST